MLLAHLSCARQPALTTAFACCALSVHHGHSDNITPSTHSINLVHFHILQHPGLLKHRSSYWRLYRISNIVSLSQHWTCSALHPSVSFECWSIRVALHQITKTGLLADRDASMQSREKHALIAQIDFSDMTLICQQRSEPIRGIPNRTTPATERGTIMA